MDKVELVKAIKQKKELSGIADSVVLSTLEDYLKKTRLQIDNLLPSEGKIIVREIRARLRKLSGQYQLSTKRDNSDLSSEELARLLKTHSSTSERLDFYVALKKIIQETKAKSILDLGCGLNPLALADKKTKYFASDIKEDELEIIKNYFKKNKISGETFVYDLRNIDSNLPKADLCIMFKVIDVVDPASKTRGKLTESIITRVPCKNILVSFATRKLSGKKMNFPERFWFEKILQKLGCSFNKFSSDNEIFYLIKKSSTDK